MPVRYDSSLLPWRISETIGKQFLHLAFKHLRRHESFINTSTWTSGAAVDWEDFILKNWSVFWGFNQGDWLTWPPLWALNPLKYGCTYFLNKQASHTLWKPLPHWPVWGNTTLLYREPCTLQLPSFSVPAWHCMGPVGACYCLMKGLSYKPKSPVFMPSWEGWLYGRQTIFSGSLLAITDTKESFVNLTHASPKYNLNIIEVKVNSHITK